MLAGVLAVRSCELKREVDAGRTAWELLVAGLDDDDDEYLSDAGREVDDAGREVDDVGRLGLL